MRTFLPDQTPEPEPSIDPAVLEAIDQESRESKFWEKIQKFIASHSGSDFANLSPQGERTQFSHKHRQLKRKGGHRPIDYQVVEDFVDLQLAYQQHDYHRALTLYFRLKRIA